MVPVKEKFIKPHGIIMGDYMKARENPDMHIPSF
jgi:hypothetical protein